MFQITNPKSNSKLVQIQFQTTPEPVLNQFTTSLDLVLNQSKSCSESVLDRSRSEPFLIQSGLGLRRRAAKFCWWSQRKKETSPLDSESLSSRLNERLEALSGAGSRHNGPVGVRGAQGILVFLRPDEAQKGSVQEVVVLLQRHKRSVCRTRVTQLSVVSHDAPPPSRVSSYD